MLIGATKSSLALVLIALTLCACTAVRSHTIDKDASYVEEDLEATPLGRLAQELSARQGSFEVGIPVARPRPQCIGLAAVHGGERRTHAGCAVFSCGRTTEPAGCSSSA